LSIEAQHQDLSILINHYAGIVKQEIPEDDE
jgi:hypothetical protein